MEQQHFGFYRVESSIREQRKRLRASWDRVVRLHSPNQNDKHIRIVTLSDLITEEPGGFVPSFGGEKLKNCAPCTAPIEAMHHGIQRLHREFVTITDQSFYLDVALYRPKLPKIIINDDTGELIEISEMRFSQ